MKNNFFLIGKHPLIALFFLMYSTCMAQGKVVVTGATINMARQVYLSTKDVSLTGSTSTINVNASTIKVAGAMASTGSFIVSNGTVETNGTASQVIPANVFTGNVIKNLKINNIPGVTMQGNLALTDTLTLASGTLASNGYLTLKSTSTNTARVAPVTSVASVPCSGDVTVERYIPAKRAYRLLTAPVTTTTSIRTNWMENTNNPSTSVNNNPFPGYGTHITGAAGAAGGFDVTSTLNPSIYGFDPSVQAYTTPANTGGLFAAGIGFRIFIRGSRSTDLNNNASAPSATTLRAKGSLFTGTMLLTTAGNGGTPGTPALAAAINGYTLMGNPYASPLNWNSLQLNNISTSMIVFDPTINGANGRGAFVTYNGSFGTNNTASSSVDNFLQSGQAFFVQTTGANPTLTIKETHKSGLLRNIFRTANALPRLTVQLLLPAQANTTESADGCKVFFSEEFPNELSAEDSYKLTNQDENLGILVQGKILSIEGRQPITKDDTVFLKVWQLLLPNYSFRINLSDFDPAIKAYLHDNYLNANIEVKTDEEIVIPFSINSDTASSSTSRFSIVFKNLSTLPIEMTNVNAFAKSKGIEVDWSVLSESNMQQYIVEKSSNGQQFAMVDSVKAKQSGSTVANYNWFDASPFDGSNYYRIKAVSLSGEVKYSKIVKVFLDNGANSLIVTANAVNNEMIQLNCKNLKKGNYGVTLFNTIGSLLYKGNINAAGGESTKVIKLTNSLPSGIYQLRLEGEEGVKNLSVLFK